MKAYLSRLNPGERRFVIGVGVLFFVVINIFWVWPHFSDWGNLRVRLEAARTKLATYDRMLQQTNALQTQIRKMESQSSDMPAEDQALQFVRMINDQANRSGVAFNGNPRQSTVVQQFFLEKIQTVIVTGGENELVDFLYNLGSDKSFIRVRDLSVRPDTSHTKLNANITLVASYQKNPPARATRPAAGAKPATSTRK